MNELVVRAVTFFTRRVADEKDLRRELEKGVGTVDIVARELRGMGYEVFTKRISLANFQPGWLEVVLDYVDPDILISIGYDANRLDFDFILEAVSNGIYVPLTSPREMSYEEALRYSELIHRASSLDLTAPTRISIGFHGVEFKTPYFPDSSSDGEESLGLAFIYPHMLKGGVEQGVKRVFGEIEAVASFVSKIAELRVLVDYSLSPWMEKSVVSLLEHMGFGLQGPGSLYGIRYLNLLIEKYARKDLATGFNQVMLPYAEDNELKKMGEMGLVRARDFVKYSSACVAGVDMVVVPWDPGELAKLILDTYVVSEIKKRPIALRAIPAPGKPGDKVALGKFGEASIIPY